MDIDDVIKTIGFGKFHVYFLASLVFVGISHTLVSLSPLYLVGPLSCQWLISKTESVGIITVLFCGMLVGSILFGMLSDKYGRMKLFKITTLCSMYFTGIITISSNYIYMIILHFINGLFISGSLTSIIIFMAEVFPINNREVGVMSYTFFTCFGSILVSFLAHVTIKALGWKYFLAFQTIPLFIAICATSWVKESPRYLLLVNKKSACLKVINFMNKLNGRDSYNEEQIKNPSKQKISLSNEIMTRKSLICIFGVSLICFNCGVSYYGIALLSNRLESISHKCLENYTSSSTVSNLNLIDDSCCEQSNDSDFHTNIISSASELPVLLFMWLMSRFIGRKFILIICNILIATMMILLNFCDPYLSVISLSLARGAALSLFPINDLFANEIFPTSIRGFAFGFCSIFTKFGSIISPIIVNKLFTDDWFLQGSITFSALNVIVALLSCVLLPETKNRRMIQNVERTEIQ